MLLPINPGVSEELLGSSKKAMVICVLVWQHLSTIFVYLKDSPDFVLASNCLTNVNDFLSYKTGIS